MASASSSVVPALEAVKVIVSSMADDSPLVRESSLSALKEITPQNPLLVLECCYAASKGGRRRFNNMAGVFTVMSCAVRALDRKDVDPALMERLVKMATADLITLKDFNVDWLVAAVNLLVVIGSYVPDLVIDEVFRHLSGSDAAVPMMVQVLAKFASAEAQHFSARLKDVLLRVLPVLGNVKDVHRPIFANAFKCWCEAVRNCSGDLPHSFLDNDVMSFLNSVFELLLRVWASSRDHKVRLSSVEAMGEMVSLVSRPQLKTALPRLIPTMLNLCNKDNESAYLATLSLHNLLTACLLSESGPPLLDFEELSQILSTLLPLACVNSYSTNRLNLSLGLKAYNKLQHCFLIVGLVYPEDLCLYLLHRCQSKEPPSRIGALCIIKHLLPRMLEAWNAEKALLIETVSQLLDEQSLGVRMALAELLVVMASHCYLSGPPAELFMVYLITQCAISDEEIKHFKSSKEIIWRSGPIYPFQHKNQEEISPFSPLELREICEKGLLLIAVTVTEMEHILWPFILKMIMPKKYTCAVGTVCKCISELCKRNISLSNTLFQELSSSGDLPSPEELFARFVVLLHNPNARGQLATQILTVLCYLGPLFPKNLTLFLQDEVPKLVAYISDPEDLKQDSNYQETWDDMIINFLAESLDIVQDTEWITSLGNTFSRHYYLYDSDAGHSALLHRCLGMLLQKVDNRTYIFEKIELMYKNANITVPMNRVGLAKGMGLVAASHLDTVLEKLKDILDNVEHSRFRRFLSFFSTKTKLEDSDDIHAALALMYGYTARYAPSSVIEARIDALVGTNMLSRLLHVQHPTAKQAVITAIDLLGNAVIHAAQSGISFPLQKRDQLLDYVLTLMGKEDDHGFKDTNLELLNTQSLALKACTTLVSIEPRLPLETRNYVMKATLGFFALPSEPSDIVEPLVNNLIILLSAIFLTSGEDGRSRAEQLLHILRLIDSHISSPLEHQRRRGCIAVYEILLKFRSLYSGVLSGLCRPSNYAHAPFVLPSRDSLCLGDRVIVYLPRCADSSSEIRKVAVQIIGLLFSISLSLPKLVASSDDIDLESSYAALSSLEDVISMLRKDASIDPSEVFNRVISSVRTLLTKDEIVISLNSCASALCDKIKQSADGAIQAVIEFITERGSELNETDISRTAQSILSAVVLFTEKQPRQEILNALSCLAESTNPSFVFNEVLTAAGHDVVTKDLSRFRGGWPMQDAFYVFSQHSSLSNLFLEHVVAVLNRSPILSSEKEKRDISSQSTELTGDENCLPAAFLALSAFFRGGGKTGKKSVEQNYSVVICALILQLGICRELEGTSQQDKLLILFSTFQSFCDCVGDLEMGKILSRYREQTPNKKWINLIRDIARCTSLKRPKEVAPICMLLSKALNRPQNFQREAAASALSEFIQQSDVSSTSLEAMVEAMCLHVADESPTVRSLCLQGLVQIPASYMINYIKQVLGVIVALLEDSDESVQLTAVQCLLTVLESSPPSDAVEPIIVGLILRLRNLQSHSSGKLRSFSFASFGALSKYGVGTQQQAFSEQVHGIFPRLILHLHDDDNGVRQACRSTLRQLAPMLEMDGLPTLLNKQFFSSDRRADYEDFILNLSRQIIRLPASRVDMYLVSTIQAFEAPWPVIQANAIYFSSCVLSLTEDHWLLASYFLQVFTVLVGKINRSPDAIVRATCSFALGILLKSSSQNTVAASSFDRGDSISSSYD